MRLMTTIVSLILALTIPGCANQPKAGNSNEAIENAQAMQTPEQKADYLVAQAKQFLSKKQYKDAMASAQYVLTNIDQDSSTAKQMIDKASAELTKNAQEEIEEMKKNINSLGR